MKLVITVFRSEESGYHPFWEGDEGRNHPSGEKELITILFREKELVTALFERGTGYHPCFGKRKLVTSPFWSYHPLWKTGSLLPPYF